MRVIESLFLGILAAAGALILEVVASIFAYSPTLPEKSHIINSIGPISAFSRSGILFFAVFAIIEESMKYLMIAKKIEKFSAGKKVMSNSFFLGAGFGLFELFLIYYQRIGSLPGLKENYLPLAEIFLLHVLTAGIIGYYAIIRNPEKVSTYLFAILTAGFFHFCYNLLASYQNLYIQMATGAFFMMLIIISFLNYLNAKRHLD